MNWTDCITPLEITGLTTAVIPDPVGPEIITDVSPK